MFVSRIFTSVALALSFGLLAAVAARAEGVDCVVSSAAQQQSELPSCASLYPDYLYDNDTSPWRIGLGAGLGERSNPLVNSDNIPIYGIVQLSYFGERFFFDNGDLGWYLAEEENWSLNAIAGMGGERSFYSFLNSGPVGFSPGLGDNELGAGAEPDLTPPVPGQSNGEVESEVASEIEPPDRDYTIDGGLELIYHRKHSDIQLQLLTDLSGRHKGQEFWLAWATPQRLGRWHIIPSLGLNWKSSQAANYYYGVDEDEATPGMPAYDVGAVTNVFARVALSYDFNSHWKLVSVLQAEKLAAGITSSPIVEDDYVRTGFIGLYYEF